MDEIDKNQLYYYFKPERMFLRHDKKEGRFFLKSVEKNEEYERLIDNNLVSQVRIYGLKISKGEYIVAKDMVDPR